MAKAGAFLFVQTHPETGDIRHMKTRHMMRQVAFLLNPAAKHFEAPFATAIMAEKRQELCQTTSYAAILTRCPEGRLKDPRRVGDQERALCDLDRNLSSD